MKPIAISIGDPSGVAPELILDIWHNRGRYQLGEFFVIADASLLAKRARLLDLRIPIKIVSPDTNFAVDKTALTVVQIENNHRDCIGYPDPANAAGTIEAIERSVAYIARGLASAVVTCPIAKKPLYDAGFRFPGHTEFLGELAQRYFNMACRPVMMLAGPDLRTVPVTVHIPLASVVSRLTTDLIIDTVQTVHGDLQKKFKIPNPRLVVAGVNPHAGEEGAMGREDIDVIEPAIKKLNTVGIDIRGPFPADTLFQSNVRAGYDCAICMYHDQALIPIKTISFNDAVNVTLGLPFVRTSPDHGTAFDIAGRGVARPDSLIAAIKLADKLT